MTPKEVRTLWVEKLLGGEYQQTTNVLHNDEGFCCLGVLCDMAVKDGLLPDPTQAIGRTSFAYEAPELSEAEKRRVLPKKVMDWAGVLTTNGAFYDPDFSDRQFLSAKNDNGYSFEQIAEIIKSEPEGLFVS